MLYEFHHQQNAKKSGSVNATYLLGGTKTSSSQTQSNGAAVKDGEDVEMQSSPPFSSSMPQPSEAEEEEASVRITFVTLVREEDLGSLKSTRAGDGAEG